MKNRIYALRKERKMTQLRLSTLLGVAQETISAYESGKHYPSVQSLLKMAELFDVSCDYILGSANCRKPYKEDLLAEDEVRLLSLYRRLEAGKKGIAMAYLQGLAD